MSLTPRTSRARRLLAAATVAVALLGLDTACGVSAATIRPGVAATVGDTTISMKTVDQATQAYCAYIAHSQQPKTTGAYARFTVVEALVLRAIATDMNRDEKLGLSTGSVYANQISTARNQLSTLTPDQQSAVFDAYTGYTFFIDFAQQLGQRANPNLGSNPQTATQQQILAGIKQIQAWLADHPIHTDPQFPTISIGDQSVEQTGQDLALPQSGPALAAQAAFGPTPSGTAGTAYLDSLPASQTCG